MAVATAAGAAVESFDGLVRRQNVTIAAATNTLEYVPVMMPTIIVKAKPCSTSPPNRKSAIADSSAVPAVMTVRPSVWLIERLMISFCDSRRIFRMTAMELALQFDRKIVIEAAVPNAREIECAVLGNDDPQASLPGEIIPSREFYDYEAKYLDESSKAVIPAELTERQVHEVQRQSIAAFRAVDCAGMARVDFFIARDSGDIFLNEVNTIPGFTTISMYPKMWEASGVSYPELIDRLIALALERHAEKQQLRTSVT